MKKSILYTSIIILNILLANYSFSYQLKVKNFNYINSNTLEFEIFIKGPSPLYYWMGQYVFNFNTAFANGGNLTYTTRNFSDLPNLLRPGCSGVFGDQLRLSPNIPPTGGFSYAPFTISAAGDGSKIIRMRLHTDACSFSGNLNLTWNNSSGFFTKVYDGEIVYDPDSDYYQLISLTNITNSSFHFVDPIPPAPVVNVLVSPGCGAFLNLKNACSAINTNAGGIYTNQNVTVSIVNNTTETSSAVLNGNIFTSCIIKPANPSVSVTAASGVTDLIVLDGADNVTIDGRVGGAGPVQLILDANNISQSCIKLIDGATNNDIKYVHSKNAVDKNILLAETNSSGNDNNTFEYNLIENGNRGISLSGSSDAIAGIMNSGNKILFNEIRDIKEIGIQVSRNTQINTIEGNIVHNVNVATVSVFYGINSSAVGLNNILRNKIYEIAGTSPNTNYFGINSTPLGNTPAVINIINNFVSIVDDNSGYMYGIACGSNINLGYVKQTTSVNHNTVFIGKNLVSSITGTTGITMNFSGMTGDESAYNQFNNISINERSTPGNAEPQGAFEYYAEPGVNIDIDYNCYYAAKYITRWNSVSYIDFAAYQSAANPNEQHTIKKDVNFVNDIAGDLHLFGSSISDFELAGKAGTGVIVDFDLEPRSLTIPYRGADESTSLGGSTSLNVKCFLQGFYISSMDQMSKSVPLTVSLRSSVSPYTLVSTGNTTLDINGNAGPVNFIIPAITSYYIVVTNWNMVDTWSKIPQSFTDGGTTAYDFSTDATKAYLDKMNQIDFSPVRWGMYVGDTYKGINSIVESNDLTQIHNSSVIYETGNIVTDLDGNEIIDVDDLIIVTNNLCNSVSFINP